MTKRNPVLGDPYPIRKGSQNMKRKPKTIGASPVSSPNSDEDAVLGIRPDPSSKDNPRRARRKSGSVY